MKALLSITLLLIAGIASAQENNYSDLLKRYRTPGIKKLELLRQVMPPFYQSLKFSIPPAPIPTPKLLFVLSNGNKVFALPQDNMPCVIPDMNQFSMPNAGANIRIYRYPQQGAIPNPDPHPNNLIVMKKRDGLEGGYVLVVPGPK